MTFEQFKTNVEAWQEERGIYAHSTALAQALKAVSEVGELADAVIKGDRDALKDAIGDAVICIVGVANMIGCDIELSETNYVNPAMGSQSLAAMTSYFVADIASDIAECCEFWKVEDSIENSIINLGGLAIHNNLTLLECCESAWHEIKDRTGKMVAGGAFVKDGEMADADDRIDVMWNDPGDGERYLEAMIGKYVGGGVIIGFEGEDAITMCMADFGSMSWDDAVQFCETFSLDKHNNWRLPTKDQLNLAWVNREKLGDLDLDDYRYWSSTQTSAGLAWVLSFIDGSHYEIYKSSTAGRVRQVRSVKIENLGFEVSYIMGDA